MAAFDLKTIFMFEFDIHIEFQIRQIDLGGGSLWNSIRLDDIQFVRIQL